MSTEDRTNTKPSDEEREFLILQYNTLRQEIQAGKASIIRLLSLGISGIPVLVGAGEKYNLDLLIYASPIITIVFILMLLHQQNGIMIPGRYIRLYIEPKLFTGANIGWERFLEMEIYNRRAEQLFSYAVRTTFVIYYLGGTFFAFLRLKAEFGDTASIFVTSAYLGLFAVAFYFVYQNYPTGTTRPEDKTDLSSRQPS